jgi:hypothetical protein
MPTALIPHLSLPLRSCEPQDEKKPGFSILKARLEKPHSSSSLKR